jgi:hypothetical protein
LSKAPAAATALKAVDQRGCTCRGGTPASEVGCATVQVVGKHAFKCLHGRLIKPCVQRRIPIDDGALGGVQHLLVELLVAKARGVTRKDFGGKHRSSFKPVWLSNRA